MSRVAKIARRTFLIGSAAVAGGIAIGYWQYSKAHDNPLEETLADGETALTPYVLIDQSGITIITPRAEMGQGVHTTLAAMVAEELDVHWDDIKVEHGPASAAYYNEAVLEEGIPFAPTDQSWLANKARDLTAIPAKFLGMQITGGSSSTPDAFIKMRKAGAAARIVLMEAAAQKLAIAINQLKTEKGHVIAPDGTRLSYMELSPLAAPITPPSDPTLKPHSQWKLLGKSLPRTDMVSKCTGTAQYAIDVTLPGMLYATVKMNPRLGGKLLSFDSTDAEEMRGVKKIIPLDGGVAVVATNTWYAFQAADAITFEWDKAPYPETTNAHFETVEQAFDGDMDSQLRNDGDIDASLTAAGNDATITGTYRAPYLAHAAMEPLNAVALLTNDRLDVWAGNQLPTQAKAEGVKLTGLAPEQVHIHTTFMGGGFGRRAEMDFIKSAIEVAKAMPGTPIKMTWSREEDTRHDAYRPLAIARFRAQMADAQPTSFDLKLASPSVIESQAGRIGLSIPGPDLTIVQGAWEQPYNIENYRVSAYRAPSLLPISSWRSVGASQNGFFHESIMDELAHSKEIDPLEMRLNMITHSPSRKVLEAVGELSDWGSNLPAGHGRGLAFVLSFGVPTAEVIEVAVIDNEVRILKAFAAADIGLALDPANIEAQIQSGINFGLSAAISGEITLEDGMIEQSNFHDFEALRLYQAPEITVRILENGERIRGIGEPATPPAAPALGNAIFAATGQRIRNLPFRNSIDFA